MENRETVPEKELMTPFIRVRKFQETLHAKAKESPRNGTAAVFARSPVPAAQTASANTLPCLKK